MRRDSEPTRGYLAVFLLILLIAALQTCPEAAVADGGQDPLAIPPKGGWTEDVILSRLVDPNVTGATRVHLLNELKEVGTDKALDFLARWEKPDHDTREYLREIVPLIQYRLTPPERQARFVEVMLMDPKNPACFPFVHIAGERGIVEALPALDELIGKKKRFDTDSLEERAYLAQLKIRYQQRHVKPLAYFLAAQCDGREDGPLHRHPCPIRLWGIRMLGTTKDPAVVKYLKAQMRALEIKNLEYLKARVNNRDRWTPEIGAMGSYYKAMYEALKSMGIDFERAPSFIPSECTRF